MPKVGEDGVFVKTDLVGNREAFEGETAARAGTRALMRRNLPANFAVQDPGQALTNADPCPQPAQRRQRPVRLQRRGRQQARHRGGLVVVALEFPWHCRSAKAKIVLNTSVAIVTTCFDPPPRSCLFPPHSWYPSFTFSVTVTSAETARRAVPIWPVWCDRKPAPARRDTCRYTAQYGSLTLWTLSSRHWAAGLTTSEPTACLRLAPANRVVRQVSQRPGLQTVDASATRRSVTYLLPKTQITLQLPAVQPRYSPTVCLVTLLSGQTLQPWKSRLAPPSNCH